jgi:hypothetical protein
VSQGAPVPIWCPPPEGHFKVNVDGVVAKTANRRAVGAVCRSHDGDYLGASPILGSSMRAEKRLLFLLIYRLARQLLPRIVWMCLRDCRRRPWGSTAMSYGRSRTRLCRAGVWCFVMRAPKLNGEAHNLERLATSLPDGHHVWLGRSSCKHIGF